MKEARGWLGTPFLHQGRVCHSDVARGGCDCIGLIAGVAKALQLKSHAPSNPLLHSVDMGGYGRVPDGIHLERMLKTHLHIIPLESSLPGDVLLLRFAEHPQHVALLSDYGTARGMIHCYAQARRVVEHRYDRWWQARTVSAFRFDLFVH